MSFFMTLDGKVAVVTGATKGVGRGVAHELAQHGMRVFATGRSAVEAEAASPVTGVQCDHRDDDAVERTFKRIADEAGTIDILVNSVWGGYERMIDNGAFTWSKPFWEQPLRRWDSMLGAGVRAAFACSRLAASRMIERGSGLIVNVSFWAAQKYLGNAIYGVAKAATDRLTADMARDLAGTGVTVVSLYPGMVRTEKVLEAAAFLDLSNSESPQFIGRAVAHLAADRDVARYSGSVVVAAVLARTYGFTDIDGREPVPLTLATL
jgi:dehydrogenase/reductase SDR family member 1